MFVCLVQQRDSKGCGEVRDGGGGVKQWCGLCLVGWWSCLVELYVFLVGMASSALLHCDVGLSKERALNGQILSAECQFI